MAEGRGGEEVTTLGLVPWEEHVVLKTVGDARLEAAPLQRCCQPGAVVQHVSSQGGVDPPDSGEGGQWQRERVPQ